MGIMVGSQYRETLDEAEVFLIRDEGDQIVIRPKGETNLQLWQRSDDFAGAVLTHNEKQFEFVRQLLFSEVRNLRKCSRLDHRFEFRDVTPFCLRQNGAQLVLRVFSRDCGCIGRVVIDVSQVQWGESC